MARYISPDMTDPEILAELGQRLRAYRIQQDLPMADLARQAGVTVLTLRSAERGGNVTMGTLLRLLRSLGRLDLLDAVLPEPGLSPLALAAARRAPPRRRARRRPRG
jgi:transcriptional regulator with XRE-family HTH domain